MDPDAVVWLDVYHWLGMAAGLLAAAVMVSGLVLATRYSFRRKGWRRGTRRALLSLHIYGGLATAAVAMVHAVGRGFQSGVLDFTPLFGHSAGIASVVLMVSGILRYRPPRPVRPYRLILVRAHTTVWIAAAVLFALHGYDEYQVWLHEQFARPDHAVSSATQARPRILTVSLVPGMYRHGTDRIVTLERLRLLDRRGRELATAKAALGGVALDLLQVHAPGDYFVEVNGLASDLVPVRIAEPDRGCAQAVGRTLQMTGIGPRSNPDYLIRTFSEGQGWKPVVRYSNGSAVWPVRYAYAVASVTSDPQSFETRVIGTGYLLQAVPFTTRTHDLRTWLIGNDNHGHHVDKSCSGCHGHPAAKPPTAAEVDVTKGWCYRCHYGPAGPSAGIVDPAR